MGAFKVYSTRSVIDKADVVDLETLIFLSSLIVFIRYIWRIGAVFILILIFSGTEGAKLFKLVVHLHLHLHHLVHHFVLVLHLGELLFKLISFSISRASNAWESWEFHV